MTPGPGGGGTTPGVGGGGTTPGAGPGGGPAGGASGGGTTGGAGGRFGPARAYKAKRRISAEQAHWLGALDLPWDGTFLPKHAPEGYEARELSLDDAAKGQGGAAAWRMDKKPTLVVLYDPSNRDHVKTHIAIQKDTTFRAASWYFNLKSLDARSLGEPVTAKEFAKGLTYVVYKADGERATVVSNPKTAEAVLEAIEPVIAADFATDADDAIQLMATIRARLAYVDYEIRSLEPLVVTKAGEKDEAVAQRRAGFVTERATLEKRVRDVTTVKEGAVVDAAR